MNLTCSVCHRHFRRLPARWTELGYKHANGRDCMAPLTADEVRAKKAKQRAEFIEDVAWMVETGESISGAVKRFGMTYGALEKALTRANRLDLLRALSRRERKVA